MRGAEGNILLRLSFNLATPSALSSQSSKKEFLQPENQSQDWVELVDEGGAAAAAAAAVQGKGGDGGKGFINRPPAVNHLPSS